MKKSSLSALVAAGLLAGGLATSASAADLGGNCCADLEERVAELEATTARKGNRKVSLTVSGWVGQQVMFWDDGVESNVYVHDLGTTLATNVKFTGQATIVPGYSAGYVIHIETIGSDGLTTNQNTDDGVAVYTGTIHGVQTLQAFWFLKSDKYGKVSVGTQSQASDNTAILVDGSGSLVPANWVLFDVNGFALRRTGNAQLVSSWGAAGACHGMGGAAGDCNGLTTHSVRYDTPTFMGFSASAGWGEDDFWDIALRYAGEFSGFKVAFAAAYNEATDEPGATEGLGAAPGFIGEELQYFQVGGYVQHVATGAFLYGAYGTLDAEGGPPAHRAPIAEGADTWYIKAGLRGKFTQLGATIPYIEYLETEADGALAVGSAGGGISTNSELKFWGLGVVQEIDAAAMSLWLKYRQFDLDENNPRAAFETFEEFAIGGLINF